METFNRFGYIIVTISRLQLVIMVILLTSSCSSPRSLSSRPTNELIQQAGNRDLADRKRLNLFHELRQRQLSLEQKKKLGSILSSVVGSPLHSPAIRKQAIDLIAVSYPEHALEWYVPVLADREHESLQLSVTEQFTKLKLKEATPFLISVLYHKHPETESYPLIVNALEHLRQKGIKAILIETFRFNPNLKVRLSALSLLFHHSDRRSITALIHQLPPEDPWATQLRFWLNQFDYIPESNRNFFHCHRLQNRLTQPQFEILAARYKHLNLNEMYRFKPEDAYLLLEAEASIFEQQRANLIRDISKRLGRQRFTRRVKNYPGAPDDYSEAFLDQHNLLSYTDLTRILLILESLAKQKTLTRIAHLLEKDLNNHRTEIGGLCFLREGRLEFREYTAAHQASDSLYVLSSQMLDDMSYCFTMWHCHAYKGQKPYNAGPGTDDLELAEHKHCSGILFTQISRDECNIDYYTSRGEVIDLGNYEL